jgi:hypothetical protein
VHVSNTNPTFKGGNIMEINAILCTFKDLVFPIFGALISLFLITRIPGVADSKNVFDEED